MPRSYALSTDFNQILARSTTKIEPQSHIMLAYDILLIACKTVLTSFVPTPGKGFQGRTLFWCVHITFHLSGICEEFSFVFQYSFWVGKCVDINYISVSDYGFWRIFVNLLV